MRILAIDPGTKRIGLSISDPTGTIANPLTVIKHVSRPVDASHIIDLAKQHKIDKIIIGQALDTEGMPTFQGRQAARLAAAIRTRMEVPVELWDESDSTRAARAARITLGSPRSKRRGHLDDLAATVILQSYLDAHQNDK